MLLIIYSKSLNHFVPYSFPFYNLLNEIITNSQDKPLEIRYIRKITYSQKYTTKFTKSFSLDLGKRFQLR